MEGSNLDQNKKTFADLVNDENKGPTFEEESEEFSGEDIIVNFLFFKRHLNFIKNQLKFSVIKEEGKNSLTIQESFKSNQDYAYVKYKLSGLLDVEPDQLVLLLNGKPIIDLYSISDVPLKKEDIIDVKINKSD